MLYIILINYNSSSDTINCVKSIIASNKYIESKICIIDNNSNEKQIQILKDFFSKEIFSDFVKVKLYYNTENSGFSAANNYWLKRIPEGEYVWILNNDTLVNENLIKTISENLPDEETVCYMDCHTFENEYHDSGIHYTNMITGRNSMKKKSVFDIGYICGASLLLKKSVKMPLWDESYFLYYEDLDYHFRLANNGFSYKKLENCYFQHKIGGSASKNNSYGKLQLRSQVLFMKRYSPCYPIYFILKLFHLLIRVRAMDVVFTFISYTFKVRKTDCFRNSI